MLCGEVLAVRRRVRKWDGRDKVETSEWRGGMGNFFLSEKS